eukprot:CAMPEP_0198241864 /NCGR_PEP_ID=MMETSP1446-20131203/6890_1 /TAXON_ID=1461542 ORGANISM="Unidentified sp, Strain CCMP2111" /NCGR_SAMPLE_ID=MMETSP1446 /ASSEMBLY_ACC=CAM_ASM_001112 /LENGTH=478 /DNA_ID=CAMNT_0043924765 /DNA_START=148 /DNA_END=1581 /DNA_ORIENTATION=+
MTRVRVAGQVALAVAVAAVLLAGREAAAAQEDAIHTIFEFSGQPQAEGMMQNTPGSSDAVGFMSLFEPANATSASAGETAAEFLNVSDMASSLGAFLNLSEGDGAACEPEYTVMGVLDRKAGSLAGYNFSLTQAAFEKTGLSSLLSTPASPSTNPSAGDFGAYLVVLPTNDAWVKLKEMLMQDPQKAQGLPLSSLAEYHVYGESNETLFNAVNEIVQTGKTFQEGAPYPYLVNVPLDMLDGNTTVLSSGTEKTAREINGSPILAYESACNGVVIVIDDVLLPGLAVDEYTNRNRNQTGAAAAASVSDDETFCGDTPPPSPLGMEWTCEEQKSWGKCAETWMWENKYCETTCEFCGKSEMPHSGQATASAAQEAEAQSYAPSASRVEQFIFDPCGCTPDGFSGKVYTGVAGCSTMTTSQLVGMAYASSIDDSFADLGRQFGSQYDSTFPGFSFPYCYVINPDECKKYTEKSPFYEGARW